MSTIQKAKTGVVRFTFCHLAEPYAYADGPNKKYSVDILIDKADTATLNTINANYDAARQKGINDYGNSFATKATPFIRPVGSDKGLLVDCDQDPRLMSDANYKGMYKLSVKSTTAPDVCKIQGGQLVIIPKEQIASEVYSGCYGKITFNFFPYIKGTGGISCGLSNVLKTMDGDYLGGRASGTSDFADEVEGTDDNGWL